MKLANHAEPLSLPLVAYPSGQRLQAIQVPNKLPSFLHEYYGVPMSPPPIGCDPKNQQGIGVLQVRCCVPPTMEGDVLNNTTHMCAWPPAEQC